MSRLEQLSRIISIRTADIEAYLVKHNVQSPFSFDDTQEFLALDLPEEMDQVREEILQAMDDLSATLLGPLGYFLDIANPKINFWAAMSMLYKFDIAQKLLPAERISYRQLAERCDLAESDVTRCLRMLMTYRIFDETEDGLVRHNSASAAVQRSSSLRDWIGVCCEEIMPAISLQATAAEKWPRSEDPAHTAYAYYHQSPGGFYAVMQEDPGRAKRFSSCLEMTLLTDAYSTAHLIRFLRETGKIPRSVIDVGGSTGSVAVELLGTFPEMQATVLDVAPVISQAKAPAELDARLKFEEYDMFTEPIKSQADACLLRQVCHNWADAYVIQILRNIVPIMENGTRLLINDICLPKKGAVRRIKEQYLRSLDLSMKLMFNALERDEAQWKTLLKMTDERLEIVTIHSSHKSLLSLIEVHLKV